MKQNNFFSSKIKSLFIVLWAFALGVTLSSCKNTTSQIPNDSPAQNLQYSVSRCASLLGIDENKLQNLLSKNKGDKEFKLIPATNSSKYKDYWCQLVTTNEDYMQGYFLDRKVYSKQSAIYQFNSMIQNMWQSQKPDTLFFIITLNDEFCGILESSGLVYAEHPRIGYITEQQYSGQGVASTSLEMFVELIKYLNGKEIYNVSDLSLWIFNNNIASQKVAKNNNFKYAEDDPKYKRKRYELKI